jgi:phage shock protein A
MGILGRLSTLIKSNVNDAIDSMQDPGKEIDQMVRDMEDYARQARAEVGRCIADERVLERRVQTIEAEIGDWEKRAETAIRAGDDELAKQALARKAEKETERDDAKKALQDQGVYADQLTAALKALETRLKDVKLRKETLKAKARSSRDGTLSNKTSAFNEFERLSSRVEATEAEADLGDELDGRTTRRIDVEKQLEKMQTDSTLDDALAELKRKLGK